MLSEHQRAVPAEGSRNQFDGLASQVPGMLHAVDEVPRTLSGDADQVPIERERLGSRMAVVVVVLAVTALAIVALPGLDDVQSRLANADLGWIALAGLLEAGSCAAFLLAFRGIMCRRLSWGVSARLGMAVQSTNVLVPTGGAGGLAFAGWALRRTGMSTATIARRTVTLFVTTSSVNFFTALAGGTLLAIGVLSADVGTALSLGPAAAALVLIVAVSQVPRLLDRFGSRLNGRIAGPTRRALAEGLKDVWRLVAERRAGALAGAAGYMLFDLAALAAAFEAVGTAPGIGVLLVAYPLGQLGGLLPVPGGVGGTDGALIGVFVLYGSPLAMATAAVLAYRVFQLGLPAISAGPAIGGTLQAVKRRSDSALPCEPAAAAA